MAIETFAGIIGAIRELFSLSESLRSKGPVITKITTFSTGNDRRPSFAELRVVNRGTQSCFIEYYGLMYPVGKSGIAYSHGIDPRRLEPGEAVTLRMELDARFASVTVTAFKSFTQIPQFIASGGMRAFFGRHLLRRMACYVKMADEQVIRAKAPTSIVALIESAITTSQEPAFSAGEPVVRR